MWPEHPGALELIRACGFKYKSAGFVWVKTKPSVTCVTLDGDGLHWGMGVQHAFQYRSVPTRDGAGAPRRLLAGDVHQVVIAPVGAHSEKPDEALSAHAAALRRPLSRTVCAQAAAGLDRMGQRDRARADGARAMTDTARAFVVYFVTARDADVASRSTLRRSAPNGGGRRAIRRALVWQVLTCR